MNKKIFILPAVMVSFILATSILYSFGVDTAVPIEDVKFVDPKLQNCFNNFAVQNGWETTKDATELFCTGIANLAGMEILEHLHDVGINIGEIHDLNPLTGSAKKLKYLMLEDEKIEDVTPLKELTKLEYLNLGGNLTLKNVNPLAELQSLHALYLFEADIEDIRALTQLKKLTVLHLSFNNVHTVGQLENLKNLTELQLFAGFAFNADSDALVLPIGQLKKLTRLTLAANRISDVSVLKNLEFLEGADFGFNRIKDLSFLKNKPHLKNLYLDGNLIHQWDYLTMLPALESLYLQDNLITAIPKHVIQAFVQNMPNLGWINLSGNPIKDCTDVEDLAAALPHTTVIAPDDCGGVNWDEILTRDYLRSGVSF